MNHLGTHGRWAFAEMADVYEIASDFAVKVINHLGDEVMKVFRVE